MSIEINNVSKRFGTFQALDAKARKEPRRWSRRLRDDLNVAEGDTLVARPRGARIFAAPAA
ncbi:MAG: hypothetical protein WC284_09155 [Candidimonas sp.]